MASWEPVSALSYFVQPMGLKVLFALLLVFTQAIIIVVTIRICRHFLSRTLSRILRNLEEVTFFQITDEGSQEILDEATILLLHSRRHQEFAA